MAWSKEPAMREACYFNLICLLTQTDKLEQSQRGADNDTDDEKPRLRAQPPIKQVTGAAKRRHRSKQRNPGRVREPALAVLFLIRVWHHVTENHPQITQTLLEVCVTCGWFYQLSRVRKFFGTS